MQYKGEDLDLRVPQGRASREFYASDYEHSVSNGRWSRNASFGISNGEPLWVDETLLSCCNYAFDIAQANGAAEVDLEHLVNALTRVEAAARLLESRGVREGQLRRESAALIASEIPATNARDAIAPRRSADFEDVLRHASDIAHRRGSAAGVDDVLWVLLHYSRDLPVVQLLRRLTPDWQRLEWVRMREPQLQVPEPASRPVSVQLVANDGMHARMAGVEDSLRLMQSEFAAERKLLMDLVRDIQRDVVAQRGDGAALRGDLGQRLETLERAVTSRSDSRSQTLVADRLTHLEQTFQGGLSEALRGTRELTQRLTLIEASLADARPISDAGPFVERIGSLEKAVHNGLGEGARNWAHLNQRLNQLEGTLGGRGDTSALEAIGERITSLERVVETSLAEGARNFGHIGQRLTAFESAFDGDGPKRIAESIAQLERRIEKAGNAGFGGQDDIVAHLEEVSKLVEASQGEVSRIRDDLSDRLSSIEIQLAERPTSPGGETGVQDLSERLGGLERAVRAGFGDAATTMGQIAERLVSVERTVHDRPRDDIDPLMIVEERIGALERGIESRSQQTLAASGEIMERLRAIDLRPASEGGFALDTASLVAPIEQKLTVLEEANVTRVDAMQSAITALVSRLDQLDERIRADSVVTEEALRGRDQDFDFIYNEIKEVAQSQATLNSAVSDWRIESQEHFSALATRLEKLVVPPAIAAATAPPIVPSKPHDIPAGVKPGDGANVVVNGAFPSPPARNVSVEANDYVLPSEPGRGFWYWLLGTSSLSAAQRENELRLDRMRDNIREARERRRTQI